MVIPVGWVEFDPEIEVQVANQNIMAAAPRLLDVAISLLEALESENPKAYSDIIDEARAAIAKALGESK